MATKKQQQQKQEATPEWEAMKSGTFHHAKSGWYGKEYLSGWYFYTPNHDNLGPFKTFEDGLKEWKKHK